MGLPRRTPLREGIAVEDADPGWECHRGRRSTSCPMGIPFLLDLLEAWCPPLASRGHHFTRENTVEDASRPSHSSPGLAGNCPAIPDIVFVGAADFALGRDQVSFTESNFYPRECKSGNRLPVEAGSEDRIFGGFFEYFYNYSFYN
ncbi:hypothetical protein QTP86_017149 [Hemibagrus guttatus]|nr:hypothetical protein QTP86_017149 [Hemibagrus guttatus]